MVNWNYISIQRIQIIIDFYFITQHTTIALQRQVLEDISNVNQKGSHKLRYFGSRTFDPFSYSPPDRSPLWKTFFHSTDDSPPGRFTPPYVSHPDVSHPDVSPIGRFTSRTFHPPEVSPPGSFTSRTFHPPGVSPPGRFTPRKFHPPDVSPSL